MTSPTANFDFVAAGETLVLTYMAIVDDGHGGVVSVPLNVTVTVHGTNDMPDHHRNQRWLYRTRSAPATPRYGLMPAAPSPLRMSI